MPAGHLVPLPDGLQLVQVHRVRPQERRERQERHSPLGSPEQLLGQSSLARGRRTEQPQAKRWP